MPSVSVPSVSSLSGSPSAIEMRLSQQEQQQTPSIHSNTLSCNLSQQPLQHSATTSSGFKWVSDFPTDVSAHSDLAPD